MENYTALIILVAIALGILDLLTDRWQKLQQQLFPLALLVLYSLFIILYYYGPDIWTYVPYYEKICTPLQLMANPKQSAQFEFGYGMFCSLFHLTGLSYWWLTVAIKTLYFLALWLLLRQLPKRQIFALSCIVMTDVNLIMHETRQCLAVSFFILMVLLMQNRKYLWAVLCAVVAVSVHKSGFMPVGLTLMGVLLYRTRQYSAIYMLLILALMALIALPVQRISASILAFLPLPSDYIISLKHHLQLGRQFQTIAIIYLALLLAFNLYLSYDRKSRYSWIAFTVLAGMGIVVLLYPYYFLLVRMRSYFVPFIVFYLVKVMSDEQRSMAIPYSSLIKQTLMVLILVYYTHLALSLERGARTLRAPVYRACTVFELRNASQKQIRDRQLNIAHKYWTQDYMKKENNKL